MSDAAAALAAPTTIAHKGKEYALSPLNLDMIAMFERWLENRAFETIRLRKGDIPNEDYLSLLNGWVEQCASGRYSWGSAACSASARSKDGMHFLTFLALAERNPQMTLRLAAEIFDASIAEIQAKMEVVNAPPFAGPTAEAGELTPAATPSPSPNSLPS